MKRIIAIILGLLLITNLCTAIYSINTITRLKKEIELKELGCRLDSELHTSLLASTKGDYSRLKESLDENLVLEGNVIKGKNTNFIIPPSMMSLRYRCIVPLNELDNKNEKKYLVIYEIYNYNNEQKYQETLFSLNVEYIYNGENYKISNIDIDIG